MKFTAKFAAAAIIAASLGVPASAQTTSHTNKTHQHNKSHQPSKSQPTKSQPTKSQPNKVSQNKGRQPTKSQPHQGGENKTDQSNRDKAFYASHRKVSGHWVPNNRPSSHRRPTSNSRTIAMTGHQFRPLTFPLRQGAVVQMWISGTPGGRAQVLVENAAKYNLPEVKRGYYAIETKMSTNHIGPRVWFDLWANGKHVQQEANISGMRRR